MPSPALLARNLGPLHQLSPAHTNEPRTPAGPATSLSSSDTRVHSSGHSSRRPGVQEALESSLWGLGGPSLEKRTQVLDAAPIAQRIAARHELPAPGIRFNTPPQLRNLIAKTRNITRIGVESKDLPQLQVEELSPGKVPESGGAASRTKP